MTPTCPQEYLLVSGVYMHLDHMHLDMILFTEHSEFYSVEAPMFTPEAQILSQ